MKRILVLTALLLAALTAHAQGVLSYANQSVSVPSAGSTVIVQMTVSGRGRIMVACSVTGNNLASFAIKSAPARFGTGTPLTLYSVSADYTSPKGLLLGTSSDLTQQAAGTTGWFIMDVHGLDILQVTSNSSNVAGSTVSCYAGGF